MWKLDEDGGGEKMELGQGNDGDGCKGKGRRREPLRTR